jgi:hypothetical protein
MPGGEGAQVSVSEYFNSCCCHMRSSVVMTQNNSICQHSSVFTVNSGFHLLFMCNMCTVDHLSMLLVVLEDGPVESSKTM